MKHQTRKQKFDDLANAINQIRKGVKVKRIGAKDGSIPTHPIVGVPDLPEQEVLIECLRWLRVHNIFHNRHDCGAGDFGYGFATYGIKGAGDIIGLTKEGRYFELECKKGKGGRLSAGQQKRMKGIRDNGGLYFVCHGVGELEFLMGEYV